VRFRAFKLLAVLQLRAFKSRPSRAIRKGVKNGEKHCERVNNKL